MLQLRFHLSSKFLLACLNIILQTAVAIDDPDPNYILFVAVCQRSSQVRSVFSAAAELTKAKINICEERSDEDSHDRDKADKTGDVETLQTGAANDPGCHSNLLTAPFQIQ